MSRIVGLFFFKKQQQNKTKTNKNKRKIKQGNDLNSINALTQL